ncbi:unnamed protein product [Protopolystoma xenopodis]|uniref:Uncharacterized protein n=1 Tax=Protopolystoma xenopodis TaxID=117903 RepID=A0A448XBD7_9PLAT|nr:unnamed protein product [Protopolystoma xenopodis]
MHSVSRFPLHFKLRFDVITIVTVILIRSSSYSFSVSPPSQQESTFRYYRHRHHQRSPRHLQMHWSLYILSLAGRTAFVHNRLFSYIKQGYLRNSSFSLVISLSR